MAPRVEQGYLVMADISGFTPFVAEGELVHSQAILSEILKVIIRNFTPTLTIAEVEGDAVFGYAPRRRLSRGETLLEIVEATYKEFRDMRESSRRMATCTCRACQMIPLLDLKFITHYGEYILHDITGRDKPLGSSVNLIHRLLKNSVSERTGWRGYALLTQPTLEQMDVFPLNTHSHVERYEHLGEVETYSTNLDDRYRELTEERRVVLEPEAADVEIHRDFDIAPPVLWEWLNEGRKRALWITGSAWGAESRPEGRTGRGASNHCSNSGVRERILDWRPFSYFTVELINKPMRITATAVLEQTGDRVRLSYRYRLNAFLPGWIRRSLGRYVVTRLMKAPENLELLARLLDEEKRRQEVPSAQPAS